MPWTARLLPNPTDPHPVEFRFDGRLFSSDEGMLRAVERLAAGSPSVAATPTGPFAPADLSLPHVAFRLVFDLAMLAGLEPEAVEVVGDDWRWPSDAAQNPYGTTDTTQEGIVY